jgi:hypothetical protein
MLSRAQYTVVHKQRNVVIDKGYVVFASAADRI